MKKIILVGAGGHCKSCVDIIEKVKNLKIECILDKKNISKLFLEKYKILNEEILEKKKINNKYFFITIGQIKTSELRKKIFTKYIKKKYKFISIISSDSIVSKHSEIGIGSIVMNYCYIGPDVKIGNNCIINNFSSIEHDSVIEDHCHISTGARINGNCFVSSGTFIGSGTVLNNNISIGKNCVIGSGLTIKKNIKDNSIIK